jgi:DNA polymerase-4
VRAWAGESVVAALLAQRTPFAGDSRGWTARTLRQVAGQCLKRVPLEQRLRLLGVRVGALARQAEVYAGAGPGAPLTAREPGALPQTGQLF